MSSIIDLLKEFVDFLKENGQIIWNNKYIFVVWTILWVSFVVVICELVRKRDKEKIQDLTDDNLKLKSTNKILNDALKKFDYESWIRVSQTPPSNPIATDISDSLKKKKRKKKKHIFS